MFNKKLKKEVADLKTELTAVKKALAEHRHELGQGAVYTRYV